MGHSDEAILVPHNRPLVNITNLGINIALLPGCFVAALLWLGVYQDTQADKGGWLVFFIFKRKFT